MRYFLIGAAGYPLLEIAWRGRTHYSMAIAGGLSTMLLHRISRTKLLPCVQCFLGGIGITAVETVCGRIWNKHHQVWDYRRMPLNWRGQVCLPYSLLWCGLSAIWLHLDKASLGA